MIKINYDKIVKTFDKGVVDKFIDDINSKCKSQCFSRFPYVLDNHIEGIADVVTSVGIWLDNKDILNDQKSKHFYT